MLAKYKRDQKRTGNAALLWQIVSGSGFSNTHKNRMIKQEEFYKYLYKWWIRTPGRAGELATEGNVA